MKTFFYDRVVAPTAAAAAVLMVACLFVSPAWGAAEGEQLDTVEHTADGVYLDFAPFGSVELPRIFLIEDENGNMGLDVFGSTTAALQSGNYGLLEVHGDEEEVVRDEEVLAEMMGHDGHLHSAIAPLAGRSIVVDFSITRHLLFGILAALLTIVLFVSLARRYKRGVGRETAPKGLFQNSLEAMVIFIRDEIAKPNIGHKYAKFLPFLLTVFFFILFCNLFGLVPYGGAATSNISVTIVLAGFTFLIGQIYASGEHWKHLFLGPEGVPWLVRVILVPVEILGLFTRHAALAIRLFANMMAGSLVILSLIGFIFTFNAMFGGGVAVGVAPVSLVLTVFISLVKLLVAFIQAYVFTILSALFIGMAVEEHSEVEGPTPELHDDTGELTPVVSGDGVDERTKVETPELAHTS